VRRAHRPEALGSLFADMSAIPQILPAVILATATILSAGEVVISRQSPDYWLPSSAVLTQSTARASENNGYPEQAPVIRVSGNETIAGSSFVISGSGTFTLASVSFQSAETRTFGSGAILDMALYLNGGNSSSGDAVIERSEVIGGITDSFDLSGLSLTIGEHVSFNLQSPRTGLLKGREYAVIFRWRSIAPSHVIRFWRSNNNNRRGGGAIWDNKASNISPFPGRDPSVAWKNDPVMCVSSQALNVSTGAVIRGTMPAWGMHTKYAAGADGYFSTSSQVTGRNFWNGRKAVDSFDPPAETVEVQVGFAAGSQVGKVIVPSAYDPAQPIGLVVFVNSDNSTYFPNSYKPLLDRLHMIGASPEQTGNNRPDPWRIARALDLTVSLMDEYNIDPERVHVAGSSGGALIAAMCGLLYPDVYDGAVCNSHSFDFDATWFEWNGQWYYGTIWHPDHWARFREQRQRWVWMEGANEADTPGVIDSKHQYWHDFGFVTGLYQVPNKGHGKPYAVDFEEALRFVDASAAARDVHDLSDWLAECYRRMYQEPEAVGPDEDTDGDGRTSLDEFFFGGDPRFPDPRPRPASMDGTVFEIECRHPASGVSFQPMASGDLDSWAPAGGVFTELAPQALPHAFARRRFQVDPSGPRLFFKGTVEAAP